MISFRFASGIFRGKPPEKRTASQTAHSTFASFFCLLVVAAAVAAVLFLLLLLLLASIENEPFFFFCGTGGFLFQWRLPRPS